MLDARKIDILNIEFDNRMAKLLAILDEAWLGERGDYASLYGETGRELGEPGGQAESPAPELAQSQPGY